VNQQVRTTFGHPTPELPVEDVERAQQHYRDALGFEIGWLYPGGSIPAQQSNSGIAGGPEIAPQQSNIGIAGGPEIAPQQSNTGIAGGPVMGAVSRDNFAIFFRRRPRPFEPAIHWIFAADIDATYEELRSRGARIVEPLEKKPWGLRQFTVEDIDGNRFYFHCD
jgi:uncharacterized glyoxalase superfamily protein PhnB